jgi:D-sedoheptulose 7-phosphate isomerase
MDLIDRISRQFEDSARVGLDALEGLAAPIAGAIEIITTCLLDNGKVLVCGSGRGGADARRFAAAMVEGFEMERPPLTAIAHADDAMAANGAQRFSRQVGALGQPGDVLLAIVADGDPSTIVAAITAAHEREMHVIALIGRQPEAIDALIGSGDISICLAAHRPPRVLELQVLVLHCLCDGIDCLLLGVED